MKQPDPKKHQFVSFTKSFIRLTRYFALLTNIQVGVAILVASELIGVYEELV
jgi:hypothetical protein